MFCKIPREVIFVGLIPAAPLLGENIDGRIMVVRRMCLSAHFHLYSDVIRSGGQFSVRLLC